MEINGGEIVGISMFICIGAAIVGAHYFGFARRKESERTIRELAQSGKPLDAAAITALMKSHNTLPTYKNLQVWGAVILALGAGLGAGSPFLSTTDNSGMIGGALLIGFIGVGLLAGSLAARPSS